MRFQTVVMRRSLLPIRQRFGSGMPKHHRNRGRAMFRPTYLALCMLAVTTALTACAGNGDGLNENGQPVGNSSGNSAALTPDLQSIQDHVFTPICAQCHAGADAPEGMRLVQGLSYSMLVGVNSVEVPSLKRVDAGDPDDSYIIHKLEGTQESGAQMPLGEPPLSADTIAVIRQWIANGAPDSPQTAATSASNTGVN